jgi:hypothetical protein
MRKRKRRVGKRNTKPASSRIFYRRPSLDFLWTAEGLVGVVLLFFPLAMIYTILLQ